MQLSTMIGQWQLVYLCDQLLIYVQSQGYTPILDSKFGLDILLANLNKEIFLVTRQLWTEAY